MFKLLDDVIKTIWKKRATRLYPKEGAVVPDGFRGRLVHLKERCIYCGNCARVCPTQAIKVDVGKRWSHNSALCIFCGQCAETCAEVPKRNAISLTRDFSMIYCESEKPYSLVDVKEE
jgi:formate hydrogenlyase subunit 6/NADH:ubiquinone oxidoreductase subunit I